MKLIYVIGKYTNPNSNYALHLPDPNGQPLCHSKQAFTTEWADAPQPTCKKCLKLLKEGS